MEAATARVALPRQLRTRNFERECERLRPLGEAYVLRRFAGSLGRADAEDAVAEVLIRLHSRMAEGRPPDNLRATFFTSVRNAAIDQLRTRAARPTVALEAAANAPAAGAIPTERAESREDAVRLQEALGRMRSNYREAILLRFGLGLTVPEIAEQLQISLPAAKKLVLRATAQVKKRLESIEQAEFCSEARDLARRGLLEKEASGLASESEGEVVRAHFSHCGACRSFLTKLHENLHELGSAALLGAAADHAGKAGVADRALGLLVGAGETAQAGAHKLRELAFRTAALLQPSDGSAGGALLGTGQKIAAVCTAGAATTATCLATGIVGPGIGATAPPPAEKPPPAKVKTVAETPPPAEEASPPLAPPEPSPTATSPASAPEANPASAPQPAPEPTPAQQSQAEFGIEPEPEPAPAPVAEPAPPPATSSGTSSPAPASGGGGSESFGFSG